MSSVRAHLALARWPNAVISAAAVGVGARWGSGTLGARVAWAMLAAVALTAAANAWNDIADVEIDRISHPERPLPSGAMTAGAARRLAWGAAVLALPLAWLARPALALLTLPVLGVMWCYSARLKRFGVAGNVVVAVVASLPVLYGACAAGAPAAGMQLVALAAPLHLAREIGKDIDDAPGDARTRRTLPLRAPGAARAALVASLLLAGAVAAPLALRDAPFALALAPAIFLCVLAARRAFRGLRGGPALMKAAMVCAMAALLIASPPRG